MGAKTQDEIDAANRYQSYVRGWTAGAAMRAMDPLFTQHGDSSLSDAYTIGYSHGQLARSDAFRHAAKKYGHTPNVLRLVDAKETP